MKTGKGKNTKPHLIRKSGKKATKKIQRRLDAEKRQREHDLLSIPEQKQQHENFRLRYLRQISSQ